MKQLIALLIAVLLILGIDAVLFGVVYMSDLFCHNKVIEATRGILSSVFIQDSVYAVTGGVILAVVLNELISKRELFRSPIPEIEKLRVVKVLIFIIIISILTYAAANATWSDWMKLFDSTINTVVDSIYKLFKPIEGTLAGIISGYVGSLIGLFIFMLLIPRLISTIEKSPKLGFFASGVVSLLGAMVITTLTLSIITPSILISKVETYLSMVGLSTFFVFALFLLAVMDIKVVLFEKKIDYVFFTGFIIQVMYVLTKAAKGQIYYTPLLTWTSVLMFAAWLGASISLILSLFSRNASMYIRASAIIGSLLATPITTLSV